MKDISEQLALHIAGEVTSVARCWKLTRRDSAVFGFTEHDRDLLIEAVIYKANSGFSPSAVQSSGGFAVDNLEIEGAFSSEDITEDDIIAGVYDYAELEIFLVNYADLSQGKLQIRRGWIGEVSFGRNNFVVEVRGLAQKLSQRVGNIFSPLCRAQLDACGVDLEPLTLSGQITKVEDNQNFIDIGLGQNTGYFNHGKLNFLSGENTGYAMEVKSFMAGGKFTLVLPMSKQVAIGDTFSVYAGCDKTFASCINKFANAVNFRGEPHVPGMDKVLETASTRSLTW